jgi:hypothetical protein
VVQTRGTGHQNDVDARVEHVAIVLAGVLKAPVASYLLEEFGAFSRDGDKLDVIATLGELGKV